MNPTPTAHERLTQIHALAAHGIGIDGAHHKHEDLGAILKWAAPSPGGSGKPDPDNYAYTISNGYRKMTIWCLDPVTRERKGILTFTPFKEFPREQKHNMLVQHLADLGIKGPEYKPTKSSVKKVTA